MVQTRKRVGAGRTERIRVRIIQVSVQAGCRRILIVRRPPDREHFAVWENRRVHLDTRLGHWWSVLPLRCRGRQVDDLGRLRRRIAATKNRDPRPVLIGRRQGEQHRRAVVRLLVYCVVAIVVDHVFVEGLKYREPLPEPE